MSTLWLQAQHTITVKHTNYTLEYDTLLKSPLISWYIQTTAHATSKNKIDRKTVADFHQDPLIPSKWQIANAKTYSEWNKQNPNDRKDIGHIVPFKAMYFDKQAAIETMYFNTNTMPQSSYFNEHQWCAVEALITDSLARHYDSVTVYTGVLINNNSQKINGVYVPDYFYKVAVYKGIKRAWLGVNNASNKDTNPIDIETNIATIVAQLKKYYPNLHIPF
jgi:DNA/RNA endonuclease G (NUC1)